MPAGLPASTSIVARLLCRYPSTAKLGGEAGTASPAEPEAQVWRLWWMVD